MRLNYYTPSYGPVDGADRSEVIVAGELAHWFTLWGVTWMLMIFKLDDPPQSEVEQIVVTTV